MHKNTCVAHVCLTVVLAAWAFGTGQVWLWVGLLWLALMGMAFGLIFPSAKKDAPEEAARADVCARLALDPSLAAGLAATLFFCVQAANGGRELVYDPSIDQWAFSLPVWRWGPSSVIAADAWRTAVIACVFTCVCATLRHALGKSGKILILEAMSVNAAALALWMLIRMALQNGFFIMRLPVFLFAAQP